MRDDQWTKFKDFLPGQEGHVVGTATDNRFYVDAIIYRTRTGFPWRLRRRCESSVFACILDALAQLPEDMQEQAARIIIEFVSYQAERETATA